MTKQRAGTQQSLIVTALDFAGTFLFAVEGALAAIAGRLDLFGVLVVAFITALGGGIVRDVLIGAAPPAALRDWRYAALAIAGGGMTIMLWHLGLQPPVFAVTLLEAAALALFAVAGTEKALEYNIPPFTAPLLGIITAVGGGTIRDILLNLIPAVLRVDINATAALAGASVMVVLRRSAAGPRIAMIAGFGTCFLLRLLAVEFHWQLPVLSS
jgi:uncharacterized membrane protein YeiH